MAITNITPKLVSTIASAIGSSPTEIEPDSGLDTTVGWDSFGHLRIILDVEFEFGVQFDSSRIPELTTAELIQRELDVLVLNKIAE